MIRFLIRVIPTCLFLAASIQAGTVADNFNTPHNYLTAGLAGTIWDGLYTGAGSFSGGNVGTDGSGATLRADADITGTGLLTVQSVQTSWENKGDDGFFLFKNVAGDFSVSVHVIAPYDTTAYNTAGLMARAAAANGSPFNGKENNISWTRFDEFGYANYLRSTLNNTSAQINPGNYPNTNYWLRMDRVNGTNFNLYEKAHASDPWQVVTFPSPVNGTNLIRADLAGVPLQVGLIQATYFVIPLEVQFESFSITGTNVGIGPVSFATQPQGQSLLQGRTATLVANVVGTPPVSLQWYRNNSPLAGQTNLVLSFATALADNNASYQLWATNVIGSVTNTASSSPAILSVTADPVQPLLTGADGTLANGVVLHFSEPITQDTATNSNFYTLTGPNGAVAISAAIPDATGSNISLVTPALALGGTYTASVNGITDLAGNMIEPGNQVEFQFMGAPPTVTLADNFNYSHDYLAGGLAGTMWDGLYTGAGSFPGQTIGPAAGVTLTANANLTAANVLTVKSQNTDWETNDDGFFLFKNVTGNFSVSVHIITPFDNTSYNTAGLLVRAAGPGGAPYTNGYENFISWTRFDQANYPNYFRMAVNNTVSQINPGGYPNNDYWLRIDRVNDTQFNVYQKALEGDAWQLTSLGGLVNGTTLNRSDLAGVPLQVGICHATFASTALQVQFEKFSLTGTNIGNGEVAFAAQPQNQTVAIGQTATFAADARGLPPIALQWLRNGLPMANQTNFNLTFTATAGDQNASYQLLASNTVSGTVYSAASSNATLTVTGDLTPPRLVNAQSAGTNGVTLFLSEPLATASVTNITNYTLLGPSGPVGINNANLDSTGANITLSTAPLLAGSNYTVTVSNVTDLAGNPIAPGASASFVVSPYLFADIGAPVPAGSFVNTNNNLGLRGGGAGIGGNADQFSFGYQNLTGNFDVQIRLGSLGLSDLWASAGLMARDGLSTNNIFAAALATPGPSGAFFESRSTPAFAATRAGDFPVNYPNMWLRLQRAGNVFTGYASLDGIYWTQLGSVTMTASATLEVGIAVTSHNAGQSTVASFDSASNTVSLALNSQPLPIEPIGPSSRHTGLVFSEIMYHPIASGPGSLEFVELYNSDLVYEDLSGYRLAGDIQYTFPPGTTLSSGGYLVVASDPATLQTTYGISGVFGPYTNKLSNSKGTLQLLNDLNSVLLEVDYDSVPPWPAAADGAGHSLVLRRASYGENDPRAWGISDVIGGSPGRGDGLGTEVLRPVVINEFLAHAGGIGLETIEIFNPGNQTLNVGGCTLSDDPDIAKFTIPTNTMIAARGFLYFDESQLGFRPSSAGGTLYLKNPSQTRVLDAVRYEPQQSGISFGRYPDGSDQWYRMSAPTFGSTNAAPLFSQIGINEIMYKPISGSDDDQYVELYNRGTNAVDISRWSFTSGITYTFPTNTVIPSNGYFVVAANISRIFANYTNLNPGNTFGNFGGKLSHHGERLALAMPEAQATTNGVGGMTTNVVAIVVDEVTYGTGGRWGQWADGGGSSLELVDPHSDKRFAANWADSDETAKAPWTTIQRTDTIDLGMGTTGQSVPNRVELMSQDSGEFLLDDVEVLSNGGTNYVLNSGFESGTNGWTFQGTFAPTRLESRLPAYDGLNSLHVRGVGGGDTGANRIRSAISTLPVGGTNRATLRARVRWLKGDTNFLMRIRGNWLECEGGMTVPSNLGTPGLPNSQVVANAGPAISQVSHYPILPAAGQPVVVTARVLDPDGISQVMLSYRLDPSATYSSVVMRDDGSGGDATAGDGIYSATIPGQANGVMVAFYLQATDAHLPSASAAFPADAPAHECLVRFGETLATGNLGSYRMWLTQSNIAYWNAREKNSNEGLDATFAYGNCRVIYNAHTDYSGSPWHTPSYNGPLGSFPCNYEMEFSDDDAFLGSTAFVLESQGPTDGNTFNNDASAQAETTAHWMAHKLGIRPDNRRYVLVYMNGGARGTIYYDYQKPNSEQLKEYYPDDSNGNLHKVDDWFEFDDAGSTQNSITAKLLEFNLNGQKRTERYRWSWIPVGGSPPNDFANFYALVDAANAPGPEPYLSAIYNLVNVREWMRMFALEHMVGDWDSYGYRRGKNMYAYKPTTGPWELLLYDIQLDFGKTSDPVNQPIFDLGNTNDPTLGDPLIARMYNTPAIVREFWETLQELTGNLMLPQSYGPLMDARVAALRADGVTIEDPTSIKNWIASRRSYILGQIPQASFGLTGPTSVNTASNSLTVTGTAPLGVEEITVNGLPYPLVWTSVTNWSLTIPLRPGANALTLQAVDINGNAFAGESASVAANYTGGVVSPVGSIVVNEIMHHPTLDGAQFIELFNNQSNYSFDLSNWRMDALGYTFPPGSTIPPLGFLVLAQNRYTFPIAYGITTNTVFDQFNGSLDPNAETLTLVQPGISNASDTVVTEVRYEAGAPWPSAAVNPGSSLQLIDPTRDNWRVGNWSALSNNPTSQWVQVVANGTASSSLLYIYLQSAGDVYVDDIQLVAGNVAGVGPNLLPDGDFESGFPGTVWTVSTNLTASTLSTAFKHSGNASLHVVSSSVGTTQTSAIYQVISPTLTANAAYTLSFWYLPSSNGGPLTVRLSGSGIVGTVNPAPFSLVATPGVTNTVAASLPAFQTLWLNELQAVNLTGITNSAGQRTPWLELYNPSTNVIPLGGIYLANGYDNLTNWPFPSNAVINPGQFEIIFADGRTGLSNTNELHTSFTLSNSTGSLVLSRLFQGQPQVLDYINYSNLTPNRSYGSFPDGQSFERQEFSIVTPGGTNNRTGVGLTVAINEWVADNKHGIVNPVGGAHDDWFELYNYGSSTADLSGYYLTDTANNPFHDLIPPGWTIPPHGHLLVWADNNSTATSASGDLHVSFALSKGGEAIGLFAANGTPVDYVSFGAQTTDVSMGRYPDGGPLIYFMNQTTPRAANLFANSAPLLSVISNQTVTLGQTVSFTAAAFDADAPPQSLSFGLGAGAPSGATISSSGAFRWAPISAPATNNVSVTVSDNGTPVLSTSQSFQIVVLPPPSFTGIALAANQFTLQWPSVAGTHYQVVYKANLSDNAWTPLGPVLTGSGTMLGFTNAIDPSTNRFVRLQILP